MSDTKAIEAMICLCIIDNKFHENEKIDVSEANIIDIDDIY